MSAAPVSTDPLISEIRMLLDFITGSPVQTLKDLVVPDPMQPRTGDDNPVLLRNTAILNRLNDIEARATQDGGDPLTSQDRSFLQLLRDALGAMVRPATGLTIAYTSMVVGRQRGRYDQSRAVRAASAYPTLTAIAWRHRWAQRLLLLLAVAVTAAAVWQSAHVALGRSLLQNVQALQTQQVALEGEKTKLLEANRPPPLATPTTIGGVMLPAAPIVRLCDRPRILAWKLQRDGNAPLQLDASSTATLFESPAQQALCDRDTILASKFLVAHEGLLRFSSDWASIVRPGGEIWDWIAKAVESKPATRSNGPVLASLDSAGTSPIEAAAAPRPEQVDVDFFIAPVLLVWGNYFLPILFALLGATVYVILDFYSKLRDSLLAPRDAVLSWIRLVLGMVLGACVGLFFSTANPSASGAAPSGAAMAESITLSASGLAFIAGFGVEGVFGMLDSLVRRVFSANQDKATTLTPT